MIELLSLQEAADRLHLCGRSVQLLVRSGKLKAVHLGPGGGKLRFTPEALDAYVKACETYGSPAKSR